MKMVPQQYCLRWKHHHSNVQSMFAQLLEKGRFCDVTLYCSPNFATQVPNKDTVDPQNIRGVSLRAHRVVLAACSELLGSLLGAHEAQGEPVLVIDGAEPRHLKALLDYMYTGEMNVHRSQLASLLKTAEELRIKGLTDIRWNNKDEPPDSNSGVITTTTSPPHLKTSSSSPDIKHESSKSPVELNPEPKFELKNSSERTERTPIERMERISAGERMSEVINEALKAELRAHLSKREEINDNDSRTSFDKFSVNGGPPPLIKLPQKDKSSPPKREHYDSDTPSPKRVRRGSATENTDEDSRSTGKPERDDWHHGNLDITAERVVGWGMSVDSAEEVGSADEDDWADAPTDIGSFLHTRLEVAGDNSNDDESNESGCGSKLAAALSPGDIKIDLANVPLLNSALSKTLGSKSGPTDPRFTDVIKLNDYLKHGRRPQFWEESYVKRVMEAVRLKELEMKQAAEILGVSYGTLYGRYRDVYGCINRPYRTARDVWQAKGPSEVLDRLQRGDITLEAASSVLGVTPTNLAAYIADAPVQEKELFEPIPIEIDPSLKMKPRLIPKKQLKPQIPPSTDTKANRRPGSSGAEGEEGNSESVNNPGTASGKWPSIRVAALDSLLDTTASASALMRSRPDLTIVAAKRTDSAAE